MCIGAGCAGVVLATADDALLACFRYRPILALTKPGISFRYAANLFEGRGLAYNPGERGGGEIVSRKVMNRSGYPQCQV